MNTGFAPAGSVELCRRKVLLGLSAAGLAVPAVSSAAPEHVQTPEVELVGTYSRWFIGGGFFRADTPEMRQGLTRFITDETVLHEAESLPWGGRMVGYDGWGRLCRISGPIWAKLLPMAGVEGPNFYQNGDTVFSEITLTLGATPATPQPFRMGIAEKYRVRDGRIMQIDEFYADTATFLSRLAAMRLI